MIVTTGGRVALLPSSPACWASKVVSALVSSAAVTLWPSSSATSTAVSWSMDWLIVTITPILKSALTTSTPLTASLEARSATLMESPTAISRTTGAVGRENACEEPERDGSAARGFGRLRPVRRAAPSCERCNSLPK